MAYRGAAVEGLDYLNTIFASHTKQIRVTK